MRSGWIGVDFDGTLADYHGWQGEYSFGEPIGPMVDRVKAWLAEGYEVRVVTARATHPDGAVDPKIVEALDAWVVEHVGQSLTITASKDFDMIELWDDRCVQVLQNTGLPVVGSRSRLEG